MDITRENKLFHQKRGITYRAISLKNNNPNMHTPKNFNKHKAKKMAEIRGKIEKFTHT